MRDAVIFYRFSLYCGSQSIASHHNAGAALLQQGRQERGREVDQAGVALRPQQLRRQNINVDLLVEVYIATDFILVGWLLDQLELVEY